MSELVPVEAAPPPLVAVSAALPPGTPSLGELFAFAADAERRFRTMRMTITETIRTSRGEDFLRHDVLVRHPGWARVNRHRSDDPLGRDHDVWVSDGDTVRTFAAAEGRATDRPRPPSVVGAERPDLPDHSRLRPHVTGLPPGSLADAFAHPHGLFRNVLLSGPVSLIGTSVVCGREAFVVRSKHPRATQVLTDRPDRVVEVAIDRATGLLLLLVERVGEHVTRHAEVTSLELDEAIPDEAFRLHLAPTTRRIY